MEELEQILDIAYDNSELLLTLGIGYHACAGYYLANGMTEVKNSSEEELDEIKSHLENRRNELEKDVEKYGRQLTDLKEHLLHPKRFFTELGYRAELQRNNDLHEDQQDPVRNDYILEFFN